MIWILSTLITAGIIGYFVDKLPKVDTALLGLFAVISCAQVAAH